MFVVEGVGRGRGGRSEDGGSRRCMRGVGGVAEEEVVYLRV